MGIVEFVAALRPPFFDLNLDARSAPAASRNPFSSSSRPKIS
jgi:hypothetical protein